MNYTIKNDFLTVVIRDFGAELQSIKSNKSDFEYLFQGDEKWEGKSPILFPICGRLYDKTYTYKGKTYNMGTHGFASQSLFSVKEQTEDAITFSLVENAETLKQYPFKFELIASFKVKGNFLIQNLSVVNRDDDTLPFALGFHPGFNALERNVPIREHTVTFNKKCYPVSLGFSKSVLCNGKDYAFKLDNDVSFKITDNLFDNDSLFISEISDMATFSCPNSNKSIILKYTDMTHLGVWTPAAGEPFVCLEPVHGIPARENVIEDFEDRKLFIYLKKGETYNSYFEIQINE
jgi:galactose mutarotase-like enzyme